MRPAACRPPRGKTPEAAALGEERLGEEGQGLGAGGGGRRAGCSGLSCTSARKVWMLVGPESGTRSSLGGVAKAELACSQLSSNDGPPG